MQVISHVPRLLFLKQREIGSRKNMRKNPVLSKRKSRFIVQNVRKNTGLHKVELL